MGVLIVKWGVVRFIFRAVLLSVNITHKKQHDFIDWYSDQMEQDGEIFLCLQQLLYLPTSYPLCTPDDAQRHYFLIVKRLMTRLFKKAFIDMVRCSFSTDVNECELLSSVCGEAQCVNTDGSFLCECPRGQDYNVMIAKCEPIPTGEPPSTFE